MEAPRNLFRGTGLSRTNAKRPRRKTGRRGRLPGVQPGPCHAEARLSVAGQQNQQDTARGLVLAMTKTRRSFE